MKVKGLLISLFDSDAHVADVCVREGESVSEAAIQLIREIGFLQDGDRIEVRATEWEEN